MLALGLLACGGYAIGAQPLSNDSLSESYVSDQPPVLHTCKAVTQVPESGHAGSTGAAPCPVIDTVTSTQSLNESQLAQSLSSTPREVSPQDLQAQRQLFDALTLQAAYLTGANGSIFLAGQNGGGNFTNPGSPMH